MKLIIAVLIFHTSIVVGAAFGLLRDPPPCFTPITNTTSAKPTSNDTHQQITRSIRYKRSVQDEDTVENLGGIITADTTIAITRKKTSREVTFWFNSSQVQVATFAFYFCDIYDCTQLPQYECYYYYRVPKEMDVYICVTDAYWGEECRSWGAVGWNIGSNWGYKPQSASDRTDAYGRSLLTRMVLVKTGKGKCIRRGVRKEGEPYTALRMPFTLNIQSPGKYDNGLYRLGLYGASGSQKLGRIRLQDMQGSDEWTDMVLHKEKKTGSNPLMPNLSTKVFSVANPTFEDIIAVETGYTDTNLWLEWMRYSAQQSNMLNCYVCAGARPHLGTVPLHLPAESEECLLSLYTNTTTKDTNCDHWKTNYPIISHPTSHHRRAVTAAVYKGNYTCYKSTGEGTTMGSFPEGYCGSYSTVAQFKLQKQTQVIGDIYWLCGDLKLRPKLPYKWTGECALTKLIMPIHMFNEGQETNVSQPLRAKRELQGSLDPHVYLDAVGIPRGVPDEFKCRDQVAAGFASILPWITTNVNVDWVNYIYYNEMRFINYTRDALQGLADELGPNSKMTFQNRMALDMILAEKGGVCKFLTLGDSCCTYIPGETGPDGRVTQALKKLTDLSDEMTGNSGVKNPFTAWFESMFGSWQQAFKAIGIIIIVVLLIFCVLACCIFPLIRKLIASMLPATDTLYTSMNRENMEPEAEYDSIRVPVINFTGV